MKNLGNAQTDGAFEVDFPVYFACVWRRHEILHECGAVYLPGNIKQLANSGYSGYRVFHVLNMIVE